MHFQISLSFGELQAIRDLLCVRDEKSSKQVVTVAYLKKWQISQETICVVKVFKRDSNTGYYFGEIAKFLRAPILKYICEPLLLYLEVFCINHS